MTPEERQAKYADWVAAQGAAQRVENAIEIAALNVIREALVYYGEDARLVSKFVTTLADWERIAERAQRVVEMDLSVWTPEEQESARALLAERARV